LLLERFDERFEWCLHRLVIDGLVPRPERLRVVGLEVLVEVQCGDRDPGEAHGCSLFGHSLQSASSEACRRISRNSPAPVSSPRAKPSGSQPAERRNSNDVLSASGIHAMARVNPPSRAWSTAAASSREPWPRRPQRGSTSNGPIETAAASSSSGATAV